MGFTPPRFEFDYVCRVVCKLYLKHLTKTDEVTQIPDFMDIFPHCLFATKIIFMFMLCSLIV